MRPEIGDGGKRKARPRVLVIEDDDEIAGLVAYQLTRARYRVETAADGAAGLSSLHREIPDFVVLDRMLPGLSGDEVLRAIRDEPATRGLPVLMLTAKNEREDRIEGLEMGADDYLTKPFSPRELVLRVDAILRRAQGERLAPATGARVLSAGNLRVNLGSNAVTLAGKRIQLTPTEFRLLKTLMERPGRTQSRRQLLEAAWDADRGMADRNRTRTVDMHVRRLRAKLDEAGDWIETVRGFGYRFRGR